jgi:hypothetical protein
MAGLAVAIPSSRDPAARQIASVLFTAGLLLPAAVGGL